MRRRRRRRPASVAQRAIKKKKEKKVDVMIYIYIQEKKEPALKRTRQARKKFAAAATSAASTRRRATLMQQRQTRALKSAHYLCVCIQSREDAIVPPPGIRSLANKRRRDVALLLTFFGPALFLYLSSTLALLCSLIMVMPAAGHRFFTTNSETSFFFPIERTLIAMMTVG